MTRKKEIVSVSERVLSKAQQTEASLQGKGTVMFMIPLDKGEVAGAMQPWMINGFRGNVPKGKMVELPLPVAKLLSAKFNVDLSGKKADRSSAVRDALSD